MICTAPQGRPPSCCSRRCRRRRGAIQLVVADRRVVDDQVSVGDVDAAAAALGVVAVDGRVGERQYGVLVRLVDRAAEAVVVRGAGVVVGVVVEARIVDRDLAAVRIPQGTRLGAGGVVVEMGVVDVETVAPVEDRASVTAGAVRRRVVEDDVGVLDSRIDVLRDDVDPGAAVPALEPVERDHDVVDIEAFGRGGPSSARMPPPAVFAKAVANREVVHVEVYGRRSAGARRGRPARPGLPLAGGVPADDPSRPAPLIDTLARTSRSPSSLSSMEAVLRPLSV